MIFQECKECNKKNFADLRAHIRAHKMTWQEYEAKYGVKPHSQNTTYKVPEKEKMLSSYERELVRRLKDVK